jgi:hypothetical protein
MTMKEEQTKPKPSALIFCICVAKIYSLPIGCYQCTKPQHSVILLISLVTVASLSVAANHTLACCTTPCQRIPRRSPSSEVA